MRLIGWLLIVAGIPLLLLFGVGLIPMIVGAILVHLANQKAIRKEPKRQRR